MREFLITCMLVAGAAAAAGAQPAVFVVRHAERADAGSPADATRNADPALSQAGEARAQSLAAMLRDAKVTAIYVTQFRRTRLTAAPLASASGVAPTEIPAEDVATLVERLRAASGNVVVIGHSNTIPQLLKSLGVSGAVVIGEEDFDNLFIVMRGSPPSLLRLHYR